MLLLVLCFAATFLVRAVPARSAPAAAAFGSVRFVAVDVFVDSGAQALAAYQFEFVAKNAQIVGLEGGDSVFHDAPYYDPAALHPAQESADDRIMVAAFSTASDLPRGRVRVARLHLMLDGVAPDASPAAVAGALEKMPRKLIVATDSTGTSIAAMLSIRLAPTSQGEDR